MEGCFEILIPKNVFQDDDLDFDALLRGEATSSHPPESENYKDVSEPLRWIQVQVPTIHICRVFCRTDWDPTDIKSPSTCQKSH